MIFHEIFFSLILFSLIMLSNHSLMAQTSALNFGIESGFNYSDSSEDTSPLKKNVQFYQK